MALKINLFIFFIFFFLILLINSVDADVNKTDKPNIIMIVADDLGYNDVGFNGSLEIKTPNIDRIAQRGIVFTHGYVAHSICAPSRAAIRTGKYQQKFGFEKNSSAIPNSDFHEV